MLILFPENIGDTALQKPSISKKKKKSLAHLNMNLLSWFHLPFSTSSSLSYSIFQLKAPLGSLEMISSSPWTGWAKTHKERCTQICEAAVQQKLRGLRELRAHLMITPHQRQRSTPLKLYLQ